MRFGDEAARRQQVEQAADFGLAVSRSIDDRPLPRGDSPGSTQLPAFAQEEIIRTAISGGSLTNIFTTTVRAQLLVSYEAAVDTTVGWVREAEVPNFQTNERIRLGKGAASEETARAAEAAQHVAWRSQGRVRSPATLTSSWRTSSSIDDNSAQIPHHAGRDGGSGRATATGPGVRDLAGQRGVVGEVTTCSTPPITATCGPVRRIAAQHSKSPSPT